MVRGISSTAARTRLIWCCSALCVCATIVANGSGHISRPGGAGHALLFRDNILVKKDFKDFPTTEMTFEAWISTSDFCHAGTIMSYAKDSRATNEEQRIADFNHFVIFDPRNLLACHDFTYIDLKPDPTQESCHASYTNVSKSSTTTSYVERDGRWHHLAVTWSVRNNGLTNIYFDGLLVASAYSQKTAPLDPNGALILGGEQDCFGGCVDPSQGFYGMMDEVKIWKTERSQEQIMRTMRWASGLEGEQDLIAYWKFNEADNDDGQFRHHQLAKDSSGKGNDLQLMNAPWAMPVDITTKAGRSNRLRTGKLQFHNNFAINKLVTKMPDRSFTVEMWIRGAAVTDDDNTQQKATELFSYATRSYEDGGNVPTGFMDDAIRIERVLSNSAQRSAWDIFDGGPAPTVGSVAVYINSAEKTDTDFNEAWIYFDTHWRDSEWHHVAVTWSYESGITRCYFDGEAVLPFLKGDYGSRERIPTSQGGVDASLAVQTRRSSEGSLVLGQDQDCYGACFSPSNAFNGDMAAVRVWRTARTQDEIRRNMWQPSIDPDNDLAAQYVFEGDGVRAQEGGVMLAVDKSGSGHDLALRSNPPLFMYSGAPLTTSDGRPVGGPTPGSGGYSLALSDKQVVMRPQFNDFPSTAITVEFWMWSVDTCRPGVPFSYAHGAYEADDNAFLIFNYNSWGVSVMEDEGTLGDHESGISATDGTWHHVAVTWDSSTGRTILYDNGRPMWSVIRAKGRRIPGGGTLVIGREQDCLGGCFDSATGATGRVSTLVDQEYGPQDFFGVIEQMRIWRVVRTPAEIASGMNADDGRGPGGFDQPGVDATHPDLVAYWKFDEGAGYTVHDATGHGHDLFIAEEPKWQVTRWLSTCGNAVVEGLEECDDGDLSPDDGCGPTCKIEPGFLCTGSPSYCWRKSSPPSPRPDSPPAEPVPAGPVPGRADGAGEASSAGDGGSGRNLRPEDRHGRSGAELAASIVLMACCTVGIVAAAVFRNQIFERFPQVEYGMAIVANKMLGALPARVRGVGGGSRSSNNRSLYANLALDPEELDMMAPEFMSAAPPRGAPGHPGRYEQFNATPTSGSNNGGGHSGGGHSIGV